MRYSESYGQITPKAGDSHQTVKFEMCYGLANTWPDCSSLQCRKFCLLLYPEGPKKVCLVSYSQCAKSVSICIQDIYDYKLQNATLPTIPVSNSCCAVGILYGWTLRSTGRIRREFVPASFTTRLTFGTAGHNYLTLSIACGLQDDFFFFWGQNDGENCRYFGISLFSSTLSWGGEGCIL